jgi:hypothetical protein
MNAPCRILTFERARADSITASARALSDHAQQVKDAYRQACIAFLHAALNGAPAERLRELAAAMGEARFSVTAGRD